MDLAPAIACAAMLMGQPVPSVTVHPHVMAIPQAACEHSGRSECVGLETAWQDASGLHMAVHIAPAYQFTGWALAHAACHAVQFGHGRPWHGLMAERECDAVQARAEDCR